MLVNWQDFIAGWIAGCGGLLVGHPLDTLKVRQQILHTSLARAVKLTYKYEGPRGFYKGILFPLLTVGPSNSIFFGIYANRMRTYQGNDTFERIDHGDPYWKHKVFAAGTVAGFFQIMFQSPVELVKTTLQAQTHHKHVWKARYESTSTGMWDCMRTIYRDRGIRGLYRGVGPMLYRDIPTSGIYTLTFELLLTVDYHQGVLNGRFCKEIVAGGVAGIMSWLPVIPFDVVKSKMQADDPNNPRYRSTWDCFVKCYRSGGLRVFTQGGVAVCTRAFPTNAVIFTTYMYTLDLFNSVLGGSS